MGRDCAGGLCSYTSPDLFAFKAVDKAKGDATGTLDFKTDAFAVGVIAQQLLAGSSVPVTDTEVSVLHYPMQCTSWHSSTSGGEPAATRFGQRLTEILMMRYRGPYTFANTNSLLCSSRHIPVHICTPMFAFFGLRELAENDSSVA